ncbi:hypothetical protein [Methylibium sp. T29]|nr:hypothetical protein [Methylibium sp. T29]
MFSPDSPLKRLPPNSNRKLLICLDSFCHSAQICELAYGRLYRQLTKLALTKETQLHPWVIPEAFMHAWAIVDELHRLDGLLKATPGLVVTLPPGEPSFTEQIESITLMRNVVDHLNRTVDLVVASKLPALGKLNWITVADSGSDRYVCGVLVPGTVTYDSKGGYKPVRPRTEIGPSDHITLSVGKHSASLTDAMGHCRRSYG